MPDYSQVDKAEQRHRDITYYGRDGKGKDITRGTPDDFPAKRLSIIKHISTFLPHRQNKINTDCKSNKKYQDVQGPNRAPSFTVLSTSPVAHASVHP